MWELSLQELHQFLLSCGYLCNKLQLFCSIYGFLTVLFSLALIPLCMLPTCCFFGGEGGSVCAEHRIIGDLQVSD